VWLTVTPLQVVQPLCSGSFNQSVIVISSTGDGLNNEKQGTEQQKYKNAHKTPVLMFIIHSSN